MGFEQTIQSLNQIAWPGTFGQESAGQKSAGGRPRAFNPGGAKTPEEALTWIERLYKAGRTDELVGLLRRSAVFREAWQTLQQSSSTGFETAGGYVVSIPAAVPTPEQSGLPAPIPTAEPKGQLPRPDQDPAGQTCPVPAPKPARTLAAARQVYETQARYFAQEGANSPRISLRV